MKTIIRRKTGNLVTILGLVLIVLAGCGAPAATSAPPSAAPALPTATLIPPTATPLPPTATFTTVPATATPTKVLASPTPRPPTPTPIPAVKIVAHPGASSAQDELWLEFTFLKGETLTGDALSQSLENGVFEVILPDGTQKTFEGIPPAPQDGAAAQEAVWLPEGVAINSMSDSSGSYFLSTYTFENYNDTPHGPQIRIPLEDILQGLGAGTYQLSWRSVGTFSESLTFEWGG